MTTADKLITADPSDQEGQALAAHNARKSSRAQVFDAILELSDSETPAKVRDIARVTGLAMPIVYDSIKALKQRGRIYSDNGAFFVCGEDEVETQSVSHTVLPSGRLKLEKGDQILELNQREARALSRTLAGVVEQAVVVVMHHRQDEQQAQIRRLHREIERMRQQLVAHEPQLAIGA